MLPSNDPIPNSRIEAYQPSNKVTIPQCQVIVLAGGYFDLLHYGHVCFLEEARKAGGPNGCLVIALEPDSRILRSKKRQPVHTQYERAQILSSLRYVDKVLLLDDLKSDDEYAQLVQNVHPQLIAVTAGDPQIERKRLQAMRVGAMLKTVVDRIEPFASSKILRNGFQEA